jgi:hypothetical protein
MTYHGPKGPSIFPPEPRKKVPGPRNLLVNKIAIHVNKMERWAIDAKRCLNFLIRSFPEDDAARKPMRDSFVAAVEHLTTLCETLVKEEHEGMMLAKNPEDECPCSTCKAERFVEVITNLSRDQLMEIIATESGIDLESSIPCAAKNTIIESKLETVYEAPANAGAGSAYGAGNLIKIHDGEDVITVGNPTS